MTPVYLETSIWSHVLADDAPDARAAVLDLLKRVQAGEYEAVISAVVTDEFARAAPDIQPRLYDLLAQYQPGILEMTGEVEDLAAAYIRAGIVPPAKRDDARHVAAASVNEIPFVVSLNYRHLVNPRRKELFGHLNIVQGYASVRLVAPQELVNG
ncbi:MAG: hypothetical protein BIFFINMI_03098 [Phycisphaerae bacterium]|nr:hypothetical protein [Phycisphaerae bacterium]